MFFNYVIIAEIIKRRKVLVVAFNHILIAQVKVRVWMNFFLLFSVFILLLLLLLCWPWKLSFHQNLCSLLWNCDAFFLFNFRFSLLLYLSQFSIVSGVKTSLAMKFKPKFDLCIHWVHLFKAKLKRMSVHWLQNVWMWVMFKRRTQIFYSHEFSLFK